MIDRGFADSLRESSSAYLVEHFSEYTNDAFSEKGVPVIIAARNEENDLPATLISLAGSSCEVWPIVVENGSQDKTAQIARKMGAHVLRCTEPYKVAALQMGIRKLNSLYRLDEPVLFTDADSIVSPDWAKTLSEATKGDELKCASGSCLAGYGPSKIADYLGTLAMATQDISRLVRKQHPVGRGDNSAINFADNQDAIDSYLNINPKFFIGEDDMIFEVMEKRHNAQFTKVLGNKAMVLSRGDRFKKPRDRIACVLPGWKKHLEGLYSSDCEGIEPDKVFKDENVSL